MLHPPLPYRKDILVNIDSLNLVPHYQPFPKSSACAWERQLSPGSHNMKSSQLVKGRMGEQSLESEF